MRRSPQLAGRCMKTESATPAAYTGECSESAHLANPPSLAQLNLVASGPIPFRWGSSRHCSAEIASAPSLPCSKHPGTTRTSRCRAMLWHAAVHWCSPLIGHRTLQCGHIHFPFRLGHVWALCPQAQRELPFTRKATPKGNFCAELDSVSVERTHSVTDHLS